LTEFKLIEEKKSTGNDTFFMTNLKGYLKVEGKTVSKYRKSDKRQNYKITTKRKMDGKIHVRTSV